MQDLACKCYRRIMRVCSKTVARIGNSPLRRIRYIGCQCLIQRYPSPYQAVGISQQALTLRAMNHSQYPIKEGTLRFAEELTLCKLYREIQTTIKTLKRTAQATLLSTDVASWEGIIRNHKSISSNH